MGVIWCAHGHRIDLVTQRIEHLAKVGALDRGLKIRPMTLPDVFQNQDTPEAMYEEAGLTARHIAARAIEALGRGDIAEIDRLASA